MSADIITPSGVNFQRVQLARDVLHDRELDKALNWQTKDFILFSTNLRHCLPDIPLAAHWKYYLNLLCYRDLLLNEHDSSATIGAVFQQEGASREGYCGPLPAIFTSFHFGSYRSVAAVLIHQKIDYVMVVNDEIYQNEEQSIRATVANIQAILGTEVQFDVLNAESPGAALKMSNYLHQNVSVAIFTDGNTGVGGAFRKDKSLAKISFFGRSIYVRRGVAILSKITRKPIVPLVLHYPKSESMTPAAVFHEPIIYDPQEASDYVVKTMRRLYGILENYVSANPDQWQGWIYFHKFLDIDALRATPPAAPPTDYASCSNKTAIHFNRDRFTVFKMDDNPFLFDRDHYLTYPIEEELFNYLTGFIKRDLSIYEVEYRLGKELSQCLWGYQVFQPMRSWIPGVLPHGEFTPRLLSTPPLSECAVA